MRAPTRSPLFSRLTAALVLVGCSDYDLHRPEETEKAGEPEDTGETAEPEEDPDIDVSPSPIEFGGLPKDCPAAPIEVTISNVGLADLNVTDIQLDGSGNSAFALDWDGAPFTLAYGETKTLQVSFTPTAWVDYAIELQVTSNDPDEARKDVPTTGTGAEDTTYEETFEQDVFEQVDVLWVVDNSGSMSDDLVKVSQNFDVFIGEFLDLGLDYHMAVITTDMDNPAQSGRFVGSVITSSTSDPEAEFTAQIDLGSSGSGSEKGLEAIEAALTEPLLSSANTGFLRTDSALTAIVLSDEDDSSSMSAANFVSFFEALKSDTERTTFNTICDDMLSALTCGKYSTAADSTGGITASISTSDYTEIMEHIALTSAGLTVSFDLRYEPSDLGRVVVEVEGTAIPQDLEKGWTYDSDDNSIVFHGDSIPEPGDSGVISYPVASECPN